MVGVFIETLLALLSVSAFAALTDNFVIDADMGLITAASHLHKKLKLIPGVVETGIFPGMAVRAYFGQADGTVTQRNRR
jgi:ribose 5-phosphate isomerase A